MDPLFEKALISTKEAGDLCGYAPDYLSRLVRQGKVQGRRIGHSWFVEPGSLERFIGEQNLKKVEYAKQLSTLRGQEYRANRSPIKKTVKFLQTPMSVHSGSRITTEIAAIGMASFVMVGSLYCAYSPRVSIALTYVSDIAAAASFGFAENVKSLRDVDLPAQTNSVVAERRAEAQSKFVPQPVQMPNIGLSETAPMRVASRETRPYVAAQHVPASEVSIEREDVIVAVKSVASLVLNPARTLSLIARGYIDMGETIYGTMASIQEAYLSGISVAGEKALALGSGGRDAVADAPKTAVAFVSALGDTLVTGVARMPDLAYGASLRISMLPLEYGPKVAAAVFEAELGVARTIFAVGEGLASASLAFVEGAANIALHLPTSLDQASDTLSRSILAVRTSGPSALAAALESERGLSFTEWLALSTYETLHGAVDSTSDAIAVLLAPETAGPNPNAAPQATTSPALPTQPNIASAPASVSSSPQVEVPSIFNTYITGVSQEYVTASLETLRADLANQMVALVAPVARQTVTNVTTIQQVSRIENLSGLTVNQGNFTNSTFDGGTIKNVNSLAITSGSFTSLTTGALSSTGDISANGFLSASYFTATSSSATSTFAGALAIGTTSPWALLSVNPTSSLGSSPIFAIGSSTATQFVIDNAGKVGIGTTSPYQLLSVSGNGYFTGGLGIGMATTTAGDLAVANNAYIGGNLTIAGSNFVIGNSVSNTLTINSTINSAVVPNQNATYDLGSPSFYWDDAYIDSINVNNISAASTTIGGTSNSSFTLNSDNGSSDTEDSSLIFYRGVVVPNAVFSWNSTLDRFEFNQPSYIENAGASTTIPTLSLKGSSGQTGALLTIASSTGTNLFTVTGSTGYVGIGTSSPTHLLSVAGDINFTGTLYQNGVAFSGSQWTTSSSDIYYNTGNVGIGSTTPWGLLSINPTSANGSAPSFVVGSSTATRFVVDSAGNVGIGTATPSESGFGLNRFLDISGSSVPGLVLHASGSTQQAAVVTGGDGLTFGVNGAASSANNVIRFFTEENNSENSPSERLRISNTGFVGIGSTTPWALFSINPTSSIGSAPVFAVGSSTATRFVIDNGGLVGIGTTSPSTRLAIQDTVSTAQLRVAYDTTRYADLQVNSSGDLILTPQSTNIYTNDGNLFACASGACPSGTVTGTGNIIAETRIGIGTSTPSNQLDIVASTPTIRIRDSSLTSGFTISQSSDASTTINNVANGAIIFGTNNTERMRITNAGRVGIGTTSPTQQFSVADRLFVGANGASGLGTATSTFQGDLKITGKLDVGTIDPVYTIDGVKYATYGHSTVGIKEETMATLNLDSYNPSTRTYQHVINFSELPKGSDLWLFYQITDFGPDWEYLVVSLTPGFEGAVSYKKLPGQKGLIIESTRPGEVTARLVANRFNWKEWPTLRPDQDTPNDTGFVLSSKK